MLESDEYQGNTAASNSPFSFYLGSTQIHIRLLCPICMLYVKTFCTGFERIGDIISTTR